MRYFIYLSYNGAAYCGWQRQPNAPTVQEELEKALSTLLHCPTETVGAGRTDAGVHAAYYVAHFDAPRPIASPEDFTYHLNAMLPQDIAVSRIRAVRDDAHARFDALSREYTYYIERYKNPFTRHATWQFYVDLDVEKMDLAAQSLLRYEDFTSFAKLNSNNKTNICRIHAAGWQRTERGAVFTVRADRFLRNMVRALTGTLVDVGRGRLSVEEFCDIVESRDLSRSSGSAPARGLFLSDVTYDEELFI